MLRFAVGEAIWHWKHNQFAWREWRRLRIFLLILVGYFLTAVLGQFLILNLFTPAPTTAFQIYSWSYQILDKAVIVAIPLIYVQIVYPRLWLRNDEVKALPLDRGTLFGGLLLPLFLLLASWKLIIHALSAVFPFLMGGNIDAEWTLHWILNTLIWQPFMIAIGLLTTFTFYATIVIRRALRLQRGEKLEQVGVLWELAFPAITYLALSIGWVFRRSLLMNFSFYRRWTLSMNFDGELDWSDLLTFGFNYLNSFFFAFLLLLIMFYIFRLFWKRDFFRARLELFRLPQ